MTKTARHREKPPLPIHTAPLTRWEGCRFILSAETNPATYCGQRRRPGSSYCEAHHQLTHTHAPPLGRIRFGLRI